MTVKNDIVDDMTVNHKTVDVLTNDQMTIGQMTIPKLVCLSLLIFEVKSVVYPSGAFDWGWARDRRKKYTLLINPACGPAGLLPASLLASQRASVPACQPACLVADWFCH
jgi:hypothetical protein